nr:IS982 family transposase [Acidobacteriota bacterium]
DKGFEGYELHRRWHSDYGAAVICPPRRNSRGPWPKGLRRFLAGVRQIVETVNGKLHHAFGLSRERPHALSGAQARVAAKAALHNFCIWLNGQLSRPALAFADLVDW